MNISKSYLDTSIPSFPQGYFPKQNRKSFIDVKQNNYLSSYQNYSLCNITNSFKANDKKRFIDKIYYDKGKSNNFPIKNYYKTHIGTSLELMDFKLNYELVQVKLEKLDNLLDTKKDQNAHLKQLKPLGRQKKVINNEYLTYNHSNSRNSKFSSKLCLSREFKDREISPITVVSREYKKLEYSPDPFKSYENKGKIRDSIEKNRKHNKKNCYEEEKSESDINLDELAESLAKSIQEYNLNLCNKFTKNSSPPKDSLNEKAEGYQRKIPESNISFGKQELLFNIESPSLTKKIVQDKSITSNPSKIGLESNKICFNFSNFDSNEKKISFPEKDLSYEKIDKGNNNFIHNISYLKETNSNKLLENKDDNVEIIENNEFENEKSYDSSQKNYNLGGTDNNNDSLEDEVKNDENWNLEINGDNIEKEKTGDFIDGVKNQESGESCGKNEDIPKLEKEEKTTEICNNNNLDSQLLSADKLMIVPCNFDQLMKDEDKNPRSEYIKTDGNLTTVCSKKEIDPNDNNLSINNIPPLFSEKTKFSLKLDDKHLNEIRICSELSSARKRVKFLEETKVINYSIKDNVKDVLVVSSLKSPDMKESEISRTSTKSKKQKIKSILVKKNFNNENTPTEEEIERKSVEKIKKKINPSILKNIKQIRDIENKFKTKDKTEFKKVEPFSRNLRKSISRRISPSLKSHDIDDWRHKNHVKHNDFLNDNREREGKSMSNPPNEEKLIKSAENFKEKNGNTFEIIQNLKLDNLSRNEKQSLLKEMVIKLNLDTSKNYRFSETKEDNIMNISFISDNDESNFKSKESLLDRIMSPHSFTNEANPSQSINLKSFKNVIGRKSPTLNK